MLHYLFMAAVPLQKVSNNIIFDHTINNVRTRDPLYATAHETRCSLNKSPNRVNVCMRCNRVENLSYL
jgi:hypothetical protein